MSEAKREVGHEVEPWKASGGGEVYNADGRMVALVYGPFPNPRPIAAANAARIAAAVNALANLNPDAIGELVEAAESLFEGEDHYSGSAAQKIESTCEKHMSLLGSNIVKQKLARLRTALQGVRNRHDG